MVLGIHHLPPTCNQTYVSAFAMFAQGPGQHCQSLTHRALSNGRKIKPSKDHLCDLLVGSLHGVVQRVMLVIWPCVCWTLCAAVMWLNCLSQGSPECWINERNPKFHTKLYWMNGLFRFDDLKQSIAAWNTGMTLELDCVARLLQKDHCHLTQLGTAKRRVPGLWTPTGLQHAIIVIT